MKIVRFFTFLLIIVGALNWGLVGFFQYNLVADLFGGEASTISRFIFALVGLAGLYSLTFICKCCCRSCGSSPCNCNKKDPHQQ
jgi:uncharacterized protein